jgi:hypothetical protein
MRYFVFVFAASRVLTSMELIEYQIRIVASVPPPVLRENVQWSSWEREQGFVN